MNKTLHQGRRNFLRQASLASGGLFLGFSWFEEAGATEQMLQVLHPDIDVTGFNSYLSIAKDGIVTIASPNPELGQNIRTSFAQIVAEELDADWTKVKVVQAPLDTKRFDRQLTGGSGAIPHSWKRLRTAGATARQMLMVIAASIFSCEKENNPVAPPYMDCKVDGGVVEFTTRNAVVIGSNLQITGLNASATAVSLSINNISAGQTGTFNIGAGNFNTAAYTDATGGYSAGGSGGSGQITIVTNSAGTLQGSFQFTALDLSGKTKVVTEGRFMIYY